MTEFEKFGKVDPCKHGMVPAACLQCTKEKLCSHEKWTSFGDSPIWRCNGCGKKELKPDWKSQNFKFGKDIDLKFWIEASEIWEEAEEINEELNIATKCAEKSIERVHELKKMLVDKQIEYRQKVYLAKGIDEND